MHDFLTFLTQRHMTPGVRYGLPIATIGIVTALRLFAPLDVAPFLVYLPVIFLIGVALGRGPGLLGVVVSTCCAAWFFDRANGGRSLTAGQEVALLQYLIIASAMVFVCDALRGAIIATEATARRLAEVNRTLVESQASLRASKVEADSAREEADAAREAAEGANRAKSAFLANMSHELRTPLSAVIGYSEMLEEEADEAGQTGMLADLSKIKSNAKHLLSLINDVLDLSKVEANKMDTYAEEIDIAAFSRDAAATVDSLVRRKANTLRLDLGDGLGIMHSDAVKLRQCLFNLLSNAAKFTEAGRITLDVRREARTDGDWVSFTVIDTGIGMTPDQVQRLFERFTQADETTTRKFGGTGLGLALSRAFAQLLGGDITVESRLGEGTRFRLLVPAVLPERPSPDADEVAAPVEAAGRDVVLVIDDEASQRELLTRFLERQGFAVRAAADGSTGLDLARSSKPRVILLDVMMPGMDGWSVLGALKADEQTSKIPVVMVSFVAEAALSAAMGAADAVPKPVDWIKLKAVMDQFRNAGGDVLVVDDDAEARQRIRAVLEKNGWTVGEAGDGAEALARVMHAPPHLILLDLTMPVMDGFAFLHRLRETPGCADIPVVVLSARDISAVEREQLAEADHVFRKGEASLREIANELRRLDTRREERESLPTAADPPA